MQQSESIKELAKALMDFQSEVETIKKDATNPFFKSKYASLENTVKVIRAPMKKNGLSFSQFPTGENELTTIIMHISGEWIKATARMYPKGSTPQDQGGAITYMRRYALAASLGIVTDEDDDGNGASQPSKPTTKKEVVATVPPKVFSKPKPDSVLVLKDKITKLVKECGIPGLTKANAKTVIKSLTDLELVPENYNAIVDRLSAIADEKKRQDEHIGSI